MLYKDGALVKYSGKFNTAYGQLIKDGELHVFVGKTADGKDAYVIPVTGRGLWGGLWGYIAVDAQKEKVVGTYFYHESETAGLGARIGERDFQEQFVNRPVFGDNGEVALTVVKKGAGDDTFLVDGITGATLTSKGVGAMVTEGLSQYKEFLNNK
jgi:Na+-transporting NADH:ubiquinone oxidoreductase subunit C